MGRLTVPPPGIASAASRTAWISAEAAASAPASDIGACGAGASPGPSLAASLARPESEPGAGAALPPQAAIPRQTPKKAIHGPAVSRLICYAAYLFQGGIDNGLRRPVQP